MERPPPEFTFICMDNSLRPTGILGFNTAQREAIKYYCKTLLESNPESVVCVYLMSTCSVLVYPTSDLKQFMRDFQSGTPIQGDAYIWQSMCAACQFFSRSHKHLKKRILVFTASLTDGEPTSLIYPRSLERKLRDKHVALNIFDFFPNKSNKEYKHLRKVLIRLLTAVNHANNIIEDVHVDADDDGSGIIEMLKSSALKENIHYLSNMTRNEKKRAAPENEKSDTSVVNKMYEPRNHNVEFMKRAAPENEISDISVVNKMYGPRNRNVEFMAKIKVILMFLVLYEGKGAAEDVGNECVEPNLGKEKTTSAAVTSE